MMIFQILALFRPPVRYHAAFANLKGRPCWLIYLVEFLANPVASGSVWF